MCQIFKTISVWSLGLFIIGPALWSNQPLVRIKDIARLEGARSNQLIGTGLVIGLGGTGDKTNLTKSMVLNTMNNLGMKVDQGSMSPKNSAAVIITAELPPFTSSGDQIDVTVSTMGDAQSLEGGILIQTPLRGADGKIYAVAQGALSIGGRGAGNHKYVAKVPRGAIVEREVPMDFIKNQTMAYLLRNKDFTTANRIADSINENFGPGTALALNAARVEIKLPFSFQSNPIEFISQLDNMNIMVDQIARVIINERTGTVVMGGSVKISPIAIAHKDYTIQISSEPNTTNPAEVRNVQINETGTVGELIKTLNLMGVKAIDLIAILQEIKNAGALQASLEIL